jgi:hypothetical protein
MISKHMIGDRVLINKDNPNSSSLKAGDVVKILDFYVVKVNNVKVMHYDVEFQKDHWTVTDEDISPFTVELAIGMQVHLGTVEECDCGGRSTYQSMEYPYHSPWCKSVSGKIV